MVASLASTPSVASITSSATSAASRCRRAITTLSFSAISCVLPLRRMPAVSTNRSLLPSNSTTSSTASRVVPAIGDTIARDVPVSAFSSVDLPTFGRPMMAIDVSCCSNSPWVLMPLASASSRRCASSAPGSSRPAFWLDCVLCLLVLRLLPPSPESPPQSHPAAHRSPGRARN